MEEVRKKPTLFSEATRFKHPILLWMPFGPASPHDSLELEDIISIVLDAKESTDTRLVAVTKLERHLRGFYLSQADQAAIYQQVLEELIDRYPSPRAIEMLTTSCLEEVDLRVCVVNRDSAAVVVPTVWRRERQLQHQDVRPPGHVVARWAQAVNKLLACEAEELDAMEQRDLLAALRLLQLHVLFPKDGDVRSRTQAALAFFEGRGLCVWNELLHRVKDEAAAAENFQQNYGVPRQRALWAHLKGMVALLAWPGESEYPRESPRSSKLPTTVNSGPGWHVVIRGEIPPAKDEDDKVALERFAPLQRPISVAALPTLERITEIEQLLQAEFPWATDAITSVVCDLVSRSLFGGIELGMAPTLLVGAPGSGKSRLVRRIAEELGCGFCPLALAGMGCRVPCNPDPAFPSNIDPPVFEPVGLTLWITSWPWTPSWVEWVELNCS